MFIKKLNKLTKKDAMYSGKKAFSISVLAKDFFVPKGFVISSLVFEEFLFCNNLKDKIAKILLKVCLMLST